MSEMDLFSSLKQKNCIDKKILFKKENLLMRHFKLKKRFVSILSSKVSRGHHFLRVTDNKLTTHNYIPSTFKKQVRKDR